MAEASAPVNTAVAAGENATTKNPFADTPTTNPPDSAGPGTTEPPAVASEGEHKPADNTDATANGSASAPASAPDSAINGNGVNGSSPKHESLVPGEAKQTSAPAHSTATEAPAESTLGASAPSSSSTSAQPPVMTGALPEGDQSNSKVLVADIAEPDAKDGVEDATGASAVPKPAGPTQTDDIKGASAGSTTTSDGPTSSAPNDSSAPQPSISNGEKKDDVVDTTTSTVPDGKKGLGQKDATALAALPSTGDSDATTPAVDSVEKKDVEMKDAAPIPTSEKPSASTAAPVPVTAPATDISGVTSTTGAPTTTAATAVPEATSEKRKAPADTEETAEEPAAKKQKGAFSRVIDKAKGAVKDVKEKAKPGRKPGKREKKETAPVGRTERKTRSQARAE